LLDFIRAGVGVDRVIGADVDFAFIKHVDFQRDNGGTALIDGLCRSTQVTFFDALAPNRRNVSVVEGGAPPAALLVLKRRAMPQEAPDKLTFAVGACDFVRRAIIKIIGSLTFVTPSDNIAIAQTLHKLTPGLKKLVMFFQIPFGHFFREWNLFSQHFSCHPC
jgi:hypothetical protein